MKKNTQLWWAGKLLGLTASRVQPSRPRIKVHFVALGLTLWNGRQLQIIRVCSLFDCRPKMPSIAGLPSGDCRPLQLLCIRELRSSLRQWIRFQRGTCTLYVFIARHRKRVCVVLEIPCPYRHARHYPTVVTGATAIHSHERCIVYPTLTAQGPVRIGGMLVFRAWSGVADSPI